jgi:DNA-binding YbaB/EbfC family protein
MDIQQILKQAQVFQEKLQAIQEQLAGRRFSARAGGGMVTATVNGRGELVDLAVEPEILTGNDPQMLRDLVLAAVNAALREARDESRAEMGKLTGGLNLPGLF